MRLDAESFRLHMDSMIEKKQFKQAVMWAENGTLIYANVEELRDLYDEEYKDIVER